jgi:hypothetical protein
MSTKPSSADAAEDSLLNRRLKSAEVCHHLGISRTKLATLRVVSTKFVHGKIRAIVIHSGDRQCFRYWREDVLALRDGSR